MTMRALRVPHSGGILACSAVARSSRVAAASRTPALAYRATAARRIRPSASASVPASPSPGAAAGQPTAQKRKKQPPPPPGPAFVTFEEDLAAFDAKVAWRRGLRTLSSFRWALGELALVAALASVGTVVDQNESAAFYREAFPDLWWLIRLLGWDRVYSQPYFLGLVAVLAASLAACSYTRQLPMLKVARKWKFLGRRADFTRLARSGGAADFYPGLRLAPLRAALESRGYEVQQQQQQQGPEGSSDSSGVLYATKGLAGRLAPIGVHISMLAILAGASAGILAGVNGDLMLAEGKAVGVREGLTRGGPLGALTRGEDKLDVQLQLERFDIEYTPKGQVSQFYSDLTLRDRQGQPLAQKTISVNDPLRYRGVTIYQTDWSVSGLDFKLGVEDEVQKAEVLSVPMAKLSGKGGPFEKANGVGQETWGTFIPVPSPDLQRKGITVLAQDLQTVVIYDKEGKFVGVRRPGSGKPIVVDDFTLLIEELHGSSGLQLKMDPGVPLVYAGFGALMITTVVSYRSHSQVWALEDAAEGGLLVGGRTNRATLTFLDELRSAVAEAEAEAEAKSS